MAVRSKARTSAVDEITAAIDLAGLDDSVGYLLRRAQLAVFADLIATLGGIGLRPGTLAVLIVIGRNPGLTQSEVSAVLGIKRTNFVAVVNELEAQGWVLRRASPSDRRVNALELTLRGQAVLERARTLQADHEARIAGVLGERGRDQLLTGLRRLSGEAAPAAGGHGR